ncbi:hypothetical protein [Ectopseudomonas khazarica]|uniref:hypothetical protein n=1 Tax=Ectopseudomonas khazarica TaxID=2502979 RepID=UPI003A959085
MSAKRYLSHRQINPGFEKKTFFCHANWGNKKARPPKPADRWRPLALTLLAAFRPRSEKSAVSVRRSTDPGFASPGYDKKVTEYG